MLPLATADYFPFDDPAELECWRDSIAVLMPDARERYHLARAFAPNELMFLATTLWTGPGGGALGRLAAFANPADAWRRRCDAIPSEKVAASGWPEVARLARHRFARREEARAALIDERNRRFDAFALDLVRRRRPKAVLAHPSCCLETARWCAAERVPFIVALPLAHPAVARRLRGEEAKRNPALAGSWDLAARSPALESRYEEELALADLILCPSEFVAESCVEAGLPREKLSLTPYGAKTPDAALLAQARAAESSAPGSNGSGRPTRFLFVGYLSQRKGVGYLLDAFRRLARGSATLELAGTWHGGGAAFQPLPAGVRWLGQLDPPELLRAMARADAFVLPSLCEGSALVIYEAMAAGLPVVATRESGAPGAPGAALRIVPAANANALADAMRALTDPEERAEARAAAQALAGTWTWARSRSTLREAVFGFLIGRS
jgi:starch synthase